MIWVPTDPGAVIAPVEWEACTAGSPGGDGCRQMTRPWRRDGIGEVGEGFPAVPKLGVLDGELVMKFPRVYVDGTSSSYAEFVVAPVDGSPVRLGFRRGYYPDAGCGYQDRDFTEEFWVLGATGQDDVPISDSPEDGLVLIDVAAGTFSLPFKDDTPRDHSWYVSSQAVLRGSGPVLTVHDHQFTQEVVVHDAADDPFGAGPANVRTVLGDAAFWDVATDDTVGIRSYDPILGPQDFVRYLDDRSRGAGGLGTDGIDLVWTEGEGRSPGDVTYPVRSIVTSPYTTDPEALVPRRLRADPTTSFGVDSVKFRVGCGRAGKSEGATPKDIQIVDLEDGTAWFMNHTQQLWHGGTVLGLTCDEIFLTASVWVDGEPQGSVIQRIRFDALGEPIPPD